MHVSERVCVGMGACSAGRGGGGGAASTGPGRAEFRKKFRDPVPDPMQRPFISVNRRIASIY